MKKNLNYFIIALLAMLIITSCKKKKDAHVPPDMSFKTGGNYTSADKTILHGDSVLVGVKVTKTEDDLKSYNISYAYDGASTTTTFYNYLLLPSEFTSYSNDTWIHSRKQAGSEKWVFTILDKDGNMVQKTIILTVN